MVPGIIELEHLAICSALIFAISLSGRKLQLSLRTHRELGYRKTEAVAIKYCMPPSSVVINELAVNLWILNRILEPRQGFQYLLASLGLAWVFLCCIAMFSKVQVLKSI